MKNSIGFLVRELAIINLDGQFNHYKLRYVVGDSVGRHEKGSLIKNIVVREFDRECPGIIYMDSMLIREMPGNLWKIENERRK